MIQLKDLLKEIGEGVTPYNFKQIKNTQFLIAYTFTTETNDQYIIKFESGRARPDDYKLSFYPGTPIDDENDKIDMIMNKGEVYKILSTVVSAVKSFISKNKNASGISWVGVNSEKAGAGDQRDRLYNAYLQKNIKDVPNWKILPGTIVTKLRKVTPSN